MFYCESFHYEKQLYYISTLSCNFTHFYCLKAKIDKLFAPKNDDLRLHVIIIIVTLPNQCYIVALPGVTALRIFSQSVISTRDDNHHTQKSSNLTESISLSLPSDVDKNVSHEKRVEIAETDNELITYLKERSDNQNQEMIMENKGTLRAFTVALALSVHSIFEGLAFGLQDTINKVCINVHEYVHARSYVSAVYVTV